MIIDLVFLAVLVIMYVIGSKRGLIKSMQGVLSWAATLIIITAALSPAVNFLANSTLAEKINAAIYDKAANSPNFADKLNGSFLPGSFMGSASDALTMIIIKIIALVALLIIAKIALRLIFSVLNLTASLPVISSVNKLCGGILSLVSTLLFVYLVLALVFVFAGAGMYGYIEASYIVKYMFNHNILLQLFMKI